MNSGNDRRRWSDDLLEDVFDGILYCDAENRIVEINRAACVLLGYDSGDRMLLIGRPIADFTLAADLQRAPVESRRSALEQAGGRMRSRRRLVARDGTMRLVDAGQTMLGRGVVRIVLRDLTAEEEASARLAEREQLLRDTLAAASMATFEWLPQQDILVLSREASHLLLVPADALPRTLSDFLAHVDESDRDAVRRAATEPLTSTESTVPVRMHVRILRPNAQGYGWLKIMGRFDRDAASDRWRAIGTLHDVTERVDAERSIEQREARYRQFFERNNAPQVIADAATGLIVDVNDAAAALYGRPREAMRGAMSSSLSVGTTPEETARLVSLIESGERSYFRRRHVTATGEVRVVDVHAGAVHAEGRRLIHSIIVDVTALVDAERERQHLLDMLDASPNPVVQRLPTGEVVYANAAALALCGLRPGDPLPMIPFSALFTRAAFEQFQGTSLPAALEQGHWFGETTLVDASGRTIPMTQSLIVHRDAAGDVVRLSSMLFDITALKEREAQLAHVNDALAEATRHKSEFLANMSHELRTPLNAILGFSQLLHDGVIGPVTAEQQDALTDVLTSGTHLLRVIDDVLDLAKVEAGELEFRPEIVDVAALIDGVVDSMRVLTQAGNLTLHRFVEPTGGRPHDAEPSLPFETDATRLRQVLYNYLSNAVKFTPAGGAITIRAARMDDAALRIEVSDTGPGIAPEDIERLFVEFRQLDGGGMGQRTGTGLGLAFSRRIAEAQGGQVGVHSVVGEGSTFWIQLPGGPTADRR